MPNNFVIQQPGGLFYCMICDCHMPIWDSAFQHLKGRRHKKALHRNGRHIRFEGDNDKYFCVCCGCNIYGWINVYPHLIGNRHTVLVNKIDEALATFKVLPCNFIVRNNRNSYSCSICNCEMSGPESAVEHAAGIQHTTSMFRYGSDILLIKNNHQYYCRLCKCYFLGNHNIWLHINGRQHKSLMNDYS